MPRSPSKTRSRRAPTVTRAFLFSDLRGYTDFVEAHGDAAAAELLRAYRDLVRAEIDRYTGAEVKTEGDSFYVVFEAPSAAVECAVAVQRAVHGHAGRDTKAPIRVGIGVHAGETVPYDDQFVGSAVNIAARLASKAQAGEIIASDTLRGLVRTAVRYDMEDRGPLRLKGMGERVRAWSVEWRETPIASAPAPAVPLPLLAGTVTAPAAPVPGQIVCPIVVGREAEHARFSEILARSAEGRGEAVVLSGEAGVGKSAFVRSAIAAAGQAGFRVLYGATLEADKGLPYAPFVAAVRSGFRGIARERLGKVLQQAAPDLAQLFPELGKAQRAETASAVEQHRLSVAFFGLFTTFAREGQVLIVVEDLHWADEASLGLFHYLARELRDSRVLVLGTYRSDEMHRRHPFLRALAAMQRERVVSEISLGRLDREQVRALIDATFRQSDPNIRVSDEFRDAIYARSEGNPFFTEELLKSLVESGGLYYTKQAGWERKPIDELRIPGSVREAVRERIDRLSTEAQTTLSAAAVFGLRVPFERLREVRSVTEAQLEAHLRELIEQQLVVELGGDEDEYGFRHALTKEVVYDDLLVRERKRIHRAVADALGADSSAEPAVLAHHLIAAGDGSAATPHLLEAAARAYSAFAPREAAAHYEKAVEVGLPDDQLALTLERLAETYYAFDFSLARKAAEEGAAAYRETGDVRGLSRMVRLASRSIWQQGDAGRAAVLAQEAIDVLGALEETLELGRALANLGTLRMLARADEEAMEMSERAIAIGKRSGDVWTIAQGLITKGTTLGRQDHEEGVRLIREGVDLAIRHGLHETALRGYNNLLVGGWGHMSSDEQERILDESQRYMQRHGLEHPMLRAQDSFRLWTRGEWDRSLVVAESVPEGSFWRRMAISILAWIALGREGPDRAIEIRTARALEEAKSGEAQTLAPSMGMMALLHLHRGDRDAAHDWYARVAARAEADPGIARLFADGPTFLGVTPALYFGDLQMIDRIAGAVSRDPKQATTAGETIAMARAALAGDSVAAARAATRLYESFASIGAGALPSVAILAAEHFLARSGSLGPEWRTAFVPARAFSEGARATWYLKKLDELEARIRD